MPKNIRFVITHKNKHGDRTLTFASQARDTYATKQEAQKALDAFLTNSEETLVQVHGSQSRGTFEVRPCECWGGDDPKGIWFDS